MLKVVIMNSVLPQALLALVNQFKINDIFLSFSQSEHYWQGCATNNS